MRCFKVSIAYDGTNYHGFQQQRGAGLLTIQEVLEKKITALAKEPVKVVGAGRTDAGVHAREQVISFCAGDWAIPVERLALALNSVLPHDIVALKAQEVSSSFHARYSAVSKIYCYVVYNNPVPSPFWRFYSYHVSKTLQISTMQKASRYLIGKHDFSSFQAAGSPVSSPVRTLFRIKISRRGSLVYLFFVADGFLYNMVRIIAGTLIHVGLGKILAEEVNEILAAQDRRQAGPTAPARGLCLMKVNYPVGL